ncbi:MAG: helix-turn-helix transcriptional regulator [Candidatus Neomarinimicrobiota bacterium]|jgi:transcriptional regulator with XRE-family HTH domain
MKQLSDFAKNLKARREAKGFSQAELARRAGLSRESISKYEAGGAWKNGKHVTWCPKVENRERLAMALDCTTGDLGRASADPNKDPGTLTVAETPETEYGLPQSICATKPEWLRDLCDAIDELDPAEKSVLAGLVGSLLKKKPQTAHVRPIPARPQAG